MKLTLGFSPCPNDTFIFDALIHHKIDTEGLQFEVFYDDVETLNQKAMRSQLDITKLSYHAYAYVANQYVLLDAGSALGFGVGPMLISKRQISVDELKGTNIESQSSVSSASNHKSKTFISGDKLNSSNLDPQHSLNTVSNLKSQISLSDVSKVSKLDPKNSVNTVSNLKSHISHLKIGIPGKYTTANFLLGLAFPELTNKVELVFSDIENALLEERIDAGLIIHENRFTYQDKGLKKIIDLGDYWEKQTGCAIPLGGIVANRKLPNDVLQRINRVLRKSVEFAFANPKSALEYIRSHAQEMSEAVMYKHIDLYVNQYSLDLGDEGKKAIKLLFDTAREKNIIPEIDQDIFL